MNALALLCSAESLFEYLCTHHTCPESMCQYPRSEA